MICRKEAQKTQKTIEPHSPVEIVMRQWNTVFELCDIVRETGFAIHQYLRNGHLEKVYRNALVHRLRKQGLNVAPEYRLNVYDEDGTLLGEFFADLFIEGILIVELKAVRATLDEHVAQLLGYLRCSRIEHGLLINFGAPKFYIKKYIMQDAIHGQSPSCGRVLPQSTEAARPQINTEVAKAESGDEANL